MFATCSIFQTFYKNVFNVFRSGISIHVTTKPKKNIHTKDCSYSGSLKKPYTLRHFGPKFLFCKSSFHRKASVKRDVIKFIYLIFLGNN